MLELIVVLVRALALACRGHHELVLENLALRQQLNALRRTGTRPHLRRRDRLFWIVLAQTWRHWRAALVLVQPDTVVRWHRECLGRRWTRRSARVRPGRPNADTAIRTLVSQMAAANPLWGPLGSMASWAKTAPRWLLRDRDAIYGDAFRRRLAGMGIGEVLSSPSSPWQSRISSPISP